MPQEYLKLYVLNEKDRVVKLLSSGSYSIAWFKLADIVSRGEKERALSVYKLLMHSIQDEAFAYQLEGDILLSFDDDTALDRYHAAANIYKKNGNHQKAIAIYEHAILFKSDITILQALLDLYLAHENYNLLTKFMAKLKVINEHFYDIAQNILLEK